MNNEAKIHQLNQWSKAPEFLEESLKGTLQFIKISFRPAGGKAL